MDKILNRLKIRRGASATESHVPQSPSSTPCTATNTTYIENVQRAAEGGTSTVEAGNDKSEALETTESATFRTSIKEIYSDNRKHVCEQSSTNCAAEESTQTEAKERSHSEGANNNTNVVAAKKNYNIEESDEATSFHIFAEGAKLAEVIFSQKDLGPFCEQLRRLLDYIHSTAELNNLIYRYPSNQQSILEEQAKELHSLYMEVRAAKVNVQQVKNQRKAVRKECNAVMKTLSKIKEEEIKEMENFISLYDKTLLARWEKIRNSTQEDMVESFLHDLQGKQQALSHLQTLASHKLRQLQTCSQITTNDETKPPNVVVRRLTVSGGGRNSAARWRSKHYDKTTRSPSSSTCQDANSLPLVSMVPILLSTALGNAQQRGNGGTSNTSSESGSALGSVIQTSPQTNFSNAVHNSPERRSMLQALFSNIQHPGTHDNLPINAVTPDIIATTSGATENLNSNNNTRSRNEQNTDSDSESEYQDIELHSLCNPS